MQSTHHQKHQTQEQPQYKSTLDMDTVMNSRSSTIDMDTVMNSGSSTLDKDTVINSASSTLDVDGEQTVQTNA